MEKEHLRGYIENLKENVSDIKKRNEDMDDCSWNYEQGVLLSGNEAQNILNILEKVLAIETDEKMLNQTILLNFLFQYTQLDEKGKIPQFKKILGEFAVNYILDD